MPRESKKTATRARLVAAAREALIDGKGDFEMSQLARRAGVSDGLAYHHFGSKAGALSAVVDDFYDRQFAVVNQDLDRDAPWAEREFQRFQAWIAFLYEEPVAPVVLGNMGRSVEVAEVEAVRQKQLIDFARLSVEAGQQSGEIPESLEATIAAAVLIGAIRQTAMLVFAEEKPTHATVVTNQLWALLSGALGLHETRP